MVWALAGGKGGVGRSLLAANLGIHLARSGHRVVLVDLDLQGSNLHNHLGYARLPRSLQDFARGSITSLTELTFETPAHHLRLIGGLQRDELKTDPVAFVGQIVSQFGTLLADSILLDCGSGRGPATMAAFAASNLGVLVGTPEPSALEAVFLFTEAHLRRCMTEALGTDARAALAEKLRQAGTDPDRASFRALMVRIATIDPAARDAVAAAVRRTRLHLLLNQVRQAADEEAIPAVASGFRKCFGLALQSAGMVEHDPSVLQTVQKRRSLSQQYPNTAATKSLARIATRLLTSLGGPPRSDEEWEDLETIDNYRVLEVVPKASAKEVQLAYQILKRTYDPETTYLSPVIEAPALREMQARIENAYRTLIFLESRAVYDRHMIESGALRPEQLRGPHIDLLGPRKPHVAAVEGAGHEHTGAAAHPGNPPSAAPGAGGAPGSAGASSGEGIGDLSAPPPQTPALETNPENSGPRGLPSNGTELRTERQRQQQPLEAISARTKIRTTHLQALEEERFGDLPPAVFVRGFLKQYAACLGLPGDDITRLYMERYEEWSRLRSNRDSNPMGARRSIG
jgi:flagellar biosynthesis protein FlhG